ncbi:ubiquinol-cytochrome c reductase 11 kDa subunit [Megachile rotundata]|uniref:ubiquinol-cytochrome c reductase 11 kDa subunit n=1 Tax=Megachile rotundata TaxID=143995 RepID=UPI000258D92E|nr:PREDICTED: cytochrome b-c1 complex subunit 6, mitochondrial [Megachile rotundata]
MSFFQSFFKRYIPTVKADDDEGELVDHQKRLREKCSQQAKCVKMQERLTTCNDRVNSASETEENCLEELIDYVECVDHCVSEKLFSLLK